MILQIREALRDATELVHRDVPDDPKQVLDLRNDFERMLDGSDRWTAIAAGCCRRGNIGIRH
ncbi:hypothetical protein WL90_06600 [Burkholderia cenocepacia]|nr:hypothetical protein WL90_06600 [Burkholderia cenocepacia]KWF74588.1 hypothetical protein WL89_31035 [Burkholderia cenocepacia]